MTGPACPAPFPGAGDYEVRHGFGYSRFLHTSRGLGLDTTMFAAGSDPLSITRVSVTNHGDRRRRLSLFQLRPARPGRKSPPQQPLRHDLAGRSDRRPSGREPDLGLLSPVCGLCLGGARSGRGADSTIAADLAGFLGRDGDVLIPRPWVGASLDGRVGRKSNPASPTRW